MRRNHRSTGDPPVFTGGCLALDAPTVERAKWKSGKLFRDFLRRFVLSLRALREKRAASETPPVTSRGRKVRLDRRQGRRMRRNYERATGATGRWYSGDLCAKRAPSAQVWEYRDL
jgi:hypothetical protein